MRIQKNRKEDFKIGDLAIVKEGFLLSGLVVKVVDNNVNYQTMTGCYVQLYGLSKHFIFLKHPGQTIEDLKELFFQTKNLIKYERA